MTLRPSRRVAGLSRTLIREIFESAPEDALNLGLGEPDVPPPPELRAALAREAREGPAGYGPTAGDPGLRAAVARRYGRLAGGPEQVLIAAGAQQAMFAVIGALADPGDEILVPDPGFPGPARAAAAWGVAARAYRLRPENGFHADPDEVLALVSERTRAIVVNSPSNPTGTVEPQASCDRLGEVAERCGVALVVDDIYRDFHWAGEGPAPLPREPGTVVVVGGLSKAAAIPGWRLGWAVTSDAPFMRRLVALQQTLLTCAPRPPQRAARALFAGGAAAPGLLAIREQFRRRRDLVGALLDAAGVRHAPLEGAFYAWIDAESAGGGRALARRLLEEERIVVIPGEAFGDSGGPFVRVSYAQPVERLEEALTRIVFRLRG